MSVYLSCPPTPAPTQGQSLWQSLMEDFLNINRNELNRLVGAAWQETCETVVLRLINTTHHNKGALIRE